MGGITGRADRWKNYLEIDNRGRNKGIRIIHGGKIEAGKIKEGKIERGTGLCLFFPPFPLPRKEIRNVFVKLLNSVEFHGTSFL